ncbi:MAG: ATP-binding cassette domain-containing protein [Rhodocyclaceae bacterium]
MRFAYGEREILSGIDLTVHRGQLVAIMGGSGCGKTTLLRLIGGQLKASAGSVRVDGQELGGAEHGAAVCAAPPHGHAVPVRGCFDMSVFDNVAFPLREHARLPESMLRDLVLMKLRAVGLRGGNTLMPSELSGGMARRRWRWRGRLRSIRC